MPYFFMRFPVPSMLPISNGVGRRIPARHRADEVPGLLLLAAGSHSSVLHPNGKASGPQYAECAWRNAGDAETGNNAFLMIH